MAAYLNTGNLLRRSAHAEALCDCIKNVLISPSFKGSAQNLFDSCKGLIGATSGYVALLSGDETNNEVLFLDSGGLECTVNPELPMPIRGLRAIAYKNLEPVFDNDFMKSKWAAFMPEGHCRLDNVLFAPLIVDGKAVGIMGLANKAGGFNDEDCAIAGSFAELAAVALKQSFTTEQLKGSEKRAADSAAYWIETFNAITDFVVILSADFRIIQANDAACRHTGLPRSEIVGRKCHEVIHRTEMPFEQCPCLIALHSKRSESAEYEHDGRSYRVSSLPISGSDGEVISFVHTITDVTDQKQLLREREIYQEHLRQSEKLETVGRLAGGIAHDMNNILGGILGLADLLQENMDISDPLRRYPLNILNLSQRAAKLISELLSFARKQQLTVEPVDLRKTIEHTVTILEHTLDKRIRILTRYSDDILVVSGDASRIENMLLNLALNARDAMPDGGTLELFTEHIHIDREFSQDRLFHINHGDYVHIAVSDTGMGMDDATREQLFTPFFTTKEQGKGTGLGLAGVYGTVKQHGGFIEVDSAPGEGTRFDVYLPANNRAEAASIQEEQLLKFDLKGKKILFVDDDQTMREFIPELISRNGGLVKVCSDGALAEEYFRKNHDEIGMVVLDMVMPVMDGAACFQSIRLINPDIPVLISSGHAAEGKIEKLLETGANGYIRKPFRSRDLLSAITRILNGEKVIQQ
ncbi:MAG: response regulator [Chitinivibrionales bacterium]|nr:response regulator [Chitinivibrionales bacterium]